MLPALWPGLPALFVTTTLTGLGSMAFSVSTQNAVGLFGAIEIQQIGGPVRADTPYKVRAEVLALSESPKTENVWYRAWAADPATGEDIGSMLMYLRYMKASSKLYAE